jgi:hypothetical protein
MAGPWTLTNKATGRTRGFPTREAARIFQRAHPGRYKAIEYSRRAELRAGLTRPQLRGHAPRGTPSVTQLQRAGFVEKTQPDTLRRYYRAIQNVMRGQSLSEAARNAHIHPETVRRLDRERGMLAKEYSTEGKFRGWIVQQAATYPILTEDGDYFEHVPLDQKNASLVGRYWNDVKAALNEGQWDRLARWHGVEVRDIEGNVYRLTTDGDELRMFFEQMTDAEHEGFNRAFASERIRVRRAA